MEDLRCKEHDTSAAIVEADGLAERTMISAPSDRLE
jgi:hypothetical protein